MARASSTPRLKAGSVASAWVGVTPFFVFAIMFLIAPTMFLMSSAAFRMPTAHFTLRNLANLVQPSIVGAYWI